VIDRELDRQLLAADIARLRQQIAHHDHRYFALADPEISDLQYDQMLAELTRLEQLAPELITPDSPSQRVGEQPVDSLPQVTHRVPMLSIDNTYQPQELRAYAKRIERLLPDEPIEWVVELKVDGVAASAIYIDRRLHQGVTRGNGLVGDDVSHNLRHVQGLPEQLPDTAPAGWLEIRGEVYMTNHDLVQLNERRVAEGQPVFKNTRNVAAGTLRLLDPRISRQRRLRFFAHSLGHCEPWQTDSHTEFLSQLPEWGIPPVPGVVCLPDIEAVIAHCHQTLDHLHALDFEVDGMVIKVNSHDQRRRLGNTSKSPRWLIAYKIEKYEAVTRVRDIQLQVGKSGTVTPVGLLESVPLAGTTVSRCSLHNADEIARKDIRIGDWVVVEKAGKIIPHIVRVERHRRPEGTVAYTFPEQCPVCDSPLTRDTGGVYIRCANPNCTAQFRQRLKHFAARDCMDIDGLGSKLIDQLVESGLVTRLADLYRLSPESLAELPRMGTKSADNLLTAIDRSKQRGLARLLNSLSIRHVGKRVAKLLAEAFPSADQLRSASLDQLAQVHEIGPIIAESLHHWLHSPAGEQTLAELAECGLRLDQPPPNRPPPAPLQLGDSPDAPTGEPTDSELLPPPHAGLRPLGERPLANKTVVLTGQFPGYSRHELEQMVEQLGGRCSSSVSSQTDLVVAGEKAGSKLMRAEQLGIRVLDPAAFTQLLSGNLQP
jgi:DNA ligase (NAD+)